MRPLLPILLALGVASLGCAFSDPLERPEPERADAGAPAGRDAAGEDEDAAGLQDAGGADAGADPVDAGEAAEDGGLLADAGALPDAGDPALPPPVLHSVEPASAGASVATEVLLRGEGFGAVLWIEVGEDWAERVERVDAHTLRAVFPAVAPTQIGPREVRVVLADGGQAALEDGFEYLFDEDPVVFVHGYALSPFGTMVDRFRDAGYPDSHLHLLEYADALGSSLPNVLELEAFVEQVLTETGAERVDLVVHSMGGLSSRLYLKNRGGWLYVRDYVSIAGAHHGTGLAHLGPGDGAGEMRPAYACAGEALHDVQFELNGCLTDEGRLVDADETPHGVEDGGPVAYRSISSEQDEFILPTASSCLNQQRRNDCADPVNVRVGWLGHATILLDADVFELTLAHLQARNRSRP